MVLAMVVGGTRAAMVPLRRNLANGEQVKRTFVSSSALLQEKQGEERSGGAQGRRFRKPVSISQDDASTRVTTKPAENSRNIRPDFGPLSSSMFGGMGRTSSSSMNIFGAGPEGGQTEYPDTPEGRWKARSETDRTSFSSFLALTPPPNTPYTSRVCPVSSGGRSLDRAYSTLLRKINSDNIKGESIEKRYYVQPSSMRSRVRSQLHRKRFAAEIGTRVRRAMDLKRKGF